MAKQLDRPADVDSLYVERADPVPPWRPVMTGDVFRGCTIPGVIEHGFALILSHPCTMRNGHALRERIQAVPVVAHAVVPLERWGDGFFKVLPLPSMLEGRPEVAARLDEFGMLNAQDLDLDSRVACMSEVGVALLLQRFFFCTSRVHIELPTISAGIAGPLDEVDLLEAWLEKLAGKRVDDGAPLEAALADESKEFSDFLDAGGPVHGKTRRQCLAPNGDAPAVRRAVGQEIKRRS